MAILLLVSPIAIKASFNKVEDKVVRIDLEKKYIPKFEVTELEEEADNIYIEDATYL